MKDEYLALFDDDGNLIPNSYCKRGDALPPHTRLKAACSWIVNARGEFLITRRALEKSFQPGIWEAQGGCVSAGEDGLTAAVREAKEESGIDLDPATGELFSEERFGDMFMEHWLFRKEFDLADVVLQEGETMDARAATWSEIAAMIEDGTFFKESAEVQNFLGNLFP